MVTDDDLRNELEREKFNSACEKFCEALDALCDLSLTDEEDKEDTKEVQDTNKRPTIADVMQTLADYRGVNLDQAFDIRTHIYKITSKGVMTKLPDEDDFSMVRGIPDEVLDKDNYLLTWKPSPGKEMWYVGADGGVYRFTKQCVDEVHMALYASLKSMGNLFPTARMAKEKAEDMQKFIKNTIKDSNLGTKAIF